MVQDPDKARLDEIARRLDTIEAERAAVRARRSEGRASSAGVGLGLRIVTELLAGVIGGLVVGWLLDRWLGTSPWLLIALLVLGVAAAFRNVWKLSTRAPPGQSGGSPQDKG